MTPNAKLIKVPAKAAAPEQPMTLNELLTKHGACAEAVAWAATQPDLATAWQTCTRIDWMCWLAGRAIDERTMRHLACDFAETAWPYAGDGETLLQCILTVEIARGFADGTEDDETLDAACAAAWAAWSANAAAWAAAWAAAGAAAEDACDAAEAAETARAAARAAGATWDAARAAAGDTARDAANRQHLRIMRKRIPAAMICKAMGVQ